MSKVELAERRSDGRVKVIGVRSAAELAVVHRAHTLKKDGGVE